MTTLARALTIQRSVLRMAHSDQMIWPHAEFPSALMMDLSSCGDGSNPERIGKSMGRDERSAIDHAEVAVLMRPMTTFLSKPDPAVIGLINEGEEPRLQGCVHAASVDGYAEVVSAVSPR